MSRIKSLIENTIIIGIGTLLPRFTSLITLPIITAGLTKTELGTYDLISNMVSLFLPIVTLQLSTAAFRFLIDCRGNNRKTKEIISSILGFIIPVTIISLIILYFSLWKIERLTRSLIIVYYLFDILVVVFQQIARGLSLNKIYSTSSLLLACSNMILIIIFVKLINIGLNGVLIASSASTIIGCVVIFSCCKIYCYIDIKCINKKQLSVLLKYSWPMIPNSMSLWILSVSDRLVLSWFMGIEVTAVYAVANKIPSLLSAVQNTFVYAWQENASVVVGDNDVDEYYSIMFSGVSRLLAGAMGVIIGVSPFLFKILIKGDYSGAFQQMSILFVAIYFSCMSSFLGGIYVANKKTLSVGITTILGAVINLAVDLALVESIGIYAASISTLVSYMFLVIYRMRNIKKFQRIKYRHLEIFIIFIFLLLMCILCHEKIDIQTTILFLIGGAVAIVLNRDMVSFFFMKLKGRV